MNTNRYKPDTKGTLVPVCIFQFNNGEADLWFTKDQWDAEGGYRSIIKSMALNIRDIVKVHKIMVNPNRIPTAEWPC